MLSVLAQEPRIAIDSLLFQWGRAGSFADVREWPESVDAFEDLSFLLSSNYFNVGLAHVTLADAAYLYGTVRDLPPGTLVELGRFKGGTTFLLAAAMHPQSALFSYDLHGDAPGIFGSAELDAELAAALDRYGLAGRVRLLVTDTHSAEAPAEQCDFVFVDADHSYENVRADYEHWRPVIPRGGHLLFHDAYEEGPGRLVPEIERDDGDHWQRLPASGSIAHFVRTEVAAHWDRPREFGGRG